MAKPTKIILIIAGIFIVLIVVLWILLNMPISSSNSVSDLRSSLPPAAVSGESQSFYETGSAGYAEKVASTVMPSIATPAADEAAVSTSGTTVDRLIIKTGQLSITVKDVNDTLAQITNFAIQNKGFVVSSQNYKIENAPYAIITIRIPVEIFDKGFTSLKSMGELKSESIQGQDVTEEYVDLDAQLNNLQATEKRFLAILERTGNIPDVLEVERELKNIRSEIERMQGRIKYLKESASMSTITVNLSTDPSVLPTFEDKDKWKPVAIIKQAFRSMLDALKVVANLIIWIVIYLPVWLVIALVIYFIYRLIKWLKRKKI